MRAAFEANAPDLLAYLERRVDPRPTAADVLGDAMVNAWRRASTMPTDPEQARMWLYVVVRNTLANHRRTSGRYREAVERLRGVILHDSVLSASETDRADTQLTIRAALDSLSRADAELIRLVNWDQLSLAEVAQIEGIPPSTVRSRYAAALARLSVLLSDQPAADSSRGRQGDRTAMAPRRPGTDRG